VLNTYKNCCVDHLKKKRGGGIDEEEFEGLARVDPVVLNNGIDSCAVKE